MANRNKKTIKDTDEVVTTDVVTTETDNIVDIDLSETSKKRFRIDGDNNRILYLNTSDMNLLSRLEDANEKLLEIQADIDELQKVTDDEESHSKIAKGLSESDAKMRELVDYIFDSNVSEVCAPDGSMYDPFKGRARYEYIIERLLPLYEENISREAKSLSKKSKSYTSKYTK